MTIFERKIKPRYRSLESMVVEAASMVRPPERLRISEAAQKYRKIDGLKWDNDTAPYLTEPMDMLGSLDHTGVVFVGPARTGKSEMGLNWLLHTGHCDPADMMIVHMKRDSARDWSNKELKRFFHQNPLVGNQVMIHNTHDVKFKNGMDLIIKWPTITEFSGKTVRFVMLNDYDHMPLDIDGEGSAFDLAKMRTFTFKRFGMTFAEGSPGNDIEDAKWSANTPHEAPPAKGILEVYNRGDRRRYHWRCLNPSCRKSFEPDFHLLNYPSSSDFVEASEMTTLRCPHCHYDHVQEDKSELNVNGRWLRDFQQMLPDGTIVGEGARSDIASFWLKGPCAKYQTWAGLVLEYLRAKHTLDTTGDEGPLRKTTNTNQGLPYLPPSLAQGRLPDFLAERARDWGGTQSEPVVPDEVRFMVATVDVQGGARAGFVVQVTGFGEGNDAYVIDMFRLLKSERRNEEGERLPLDPAAYIEDWYVLIENVINKTYPLADGSGRRMSIKLTASDYGGEDGVSVMGRQFWRMLRDEHGAGTAARFQLVKGDPNKHAPMFQIKYPDANQKDKFTAARGDVPVGFINSLEMKDALSGMLGRLEPGGGMWNFPHWTPDWFYKQMTAEVRTSKGWEKPKNYRVRNEAWDLSYYALAILRHDAIKATRPDFWQKPPPWAQPWDKNSLVFGEADPSPHIQQPKKKYDLAALAKQLA